MTKNNYHSTNTGQNILLGVLAGTVVGAIAAALIGSKKGKEIRDSLYDACQNASKKVSCVAESLGDKSHEISDTFLNRNHHPSDPLNLTIGAIAVGILGISAVAFLASDSAKGIREQAIHSFESLSHKAHDFQDMAHSAAENVENSLSSWVKKINNLINNFSEKEFNYSKKNGASNSQTIDKILDLAVVAAQVFQTLKK